ncbi:MAG: hypothetical protein HAW61_02225 [Candidatus Portiera sp.]|nr:hypothetical protein [Portiera sp.]
MHLESNPKGYNIDKLLEFLMEPKSVFMFYFIGISDKKDIKQALISMFQRSLMKSSRISPHWSGKTARGTIQLNGEKVKRLVISPDNQINDKESREFMARLIDL